MLESIPSAMDGQTIKKMLAVNIFQNVLREELETSQHKPELKIQRP